MKNYSNGDRHFAQVVDKYAEDGVVMGPYASYTWINDPKHYLFSLSRYKFCAKMLAGTQHVVEIGCGDGTGLPLLLQSVGNVHGIDIEPSVIDNNTRRNIYGERLTFETLDITQFAPQGIFDSAISLDVIEHVAQEKENDFFKNIKTALTPHAICIIGTPNSTSDAYASEASRREHVNLKNHKTLVESLILHFHNVFLFSMNDEVIHTGFYPMAHYLMALAVGPRQLAHGSTP